jgi:carbamoyltransferase|tara:strand:- start:2027 stop:3757 length:1731 start_codon:yes stop_codon:yes gene_type:complete
MYENYIVLGLNYGGHDTSACLMKNGELISACEEERYTKQKHTRDFPINAIHDCLKKANLSINDVDEISLSYNPELLKTENFENIISPTRKNFKIHNLKKLKELRKQDFDLENFIRKKLNFTGKITSHLHHLCHAASCYYPSGFDDALVISHDGIGEVDCSLMGVASKGEISIFHQGNQWPNSLGLLYAAITDYLGWKYNRDEGIVMGLAPYGDDSKLTHSNQKTYHEFFKEIVYAKNDFDYEINTSWIAFHDVRSKWVSNKFIQTFGPKRKPDDPIEEHHKHVASALQNRLEEIIIEQLKKCKEKFGLKKLCFAGGIALNCSLNGKILESKLFDEIFIPPASGDNGTAIGACYLSTKNLVSDFSSKRLDNYYTGSEFTDDEIENSLRKKNVKYSKPKNFEKYVAQKLNEQKIIGWFQGGAEFGPRALGNRSILTAPFPKEMKDIVNSRVKFREEFRPFAPAILSEIADEYFEITQPSPHMLIAVTVKPQKINEIPAVVHVDNSARVQTVDKTNNPKFRKLLESFFDETGCPVLLNTSFNVKGQPIVNSPDDAIDCFLSTNIDVLAIGSFILEKNKL